MLCHRGHRSDVRSGAHATDAGARNRRDLERALKVVPHAPLNDPMVRVKVLRAMQVDGRIVGPPAVVRLCLSDAQTLAAIGRVKIVG